MQVGEAALLDGCDLAVSPEGNRRPDRGSLSSSVRPCATFLRSIRDTPIFGNSKKVEMI